MRLRLTLIKTFRAALLTVGVIVAASVPAFAQQQPGNLNGGRDCQVVRTCNFAKGGTFRGCLSSYSCRTCQLVASNCSVGAARATCQAMRCNWGG
jgi:hypothetical protein